MSKKQPQARKWVSAKFLGEYFSVSQVTIWAWTKNGRLPQPVKFSPNCTRWDFEQITAKECA